MSKKKSNGFMSFTVEWRDKNAPKMSIPKAISPAGEVWKTMSREERAPYNHRAKTVPQLTGTGGNKGKLACDGTPIATIEQEQREKEQLRQLMINSIKETVELASNGGRLEKQKFFFVYVNYFARILHTENYIPAEIAIIEFSLQDGVNRKFHEYVNPHTDFYGNRFEAVEHSKTTHNLPLPPEAFGEKELHKIHLEITNFIYDKDNDCYPPLYTDSKAINFIQSSLNFLVADDPSSVKLDVYSINELFYALKCETSNISSTQKPKNRFVTDAILERDTFEYTTNIACSYHEDIDRSHYCALSKVIRWAYTFVDYMGRDLLINCIPGKHIPGTMKVDLVMQEIRGELDNSFVQTVCDRMSHISLDTDFKTCNDFASVRSSKISCQSVARRKVDGDVLYPVMEIAEHNPWRRSDHSKPPDTRFFAVDCPEYDARESSSGSIIRRTSGRGVALLDEDEFPSLRGLGRGSLRN